MRIEEEDGVAIIKPGVASIVFMAMKNGNRKKMSADRRIYLRTGMTFDSYIRQ